MYKDDPQPSQESKEQKKWQEIAGKMRDEVVSRIAKANTLNTNEFQSLAHVIEQVMKLDKWAMTFDSDVEEMQKPRFQT